MSCGMNPTPFPGTGQLEGPPLHPEMRTSPESRCLRPTIQLSKVVLPHPELPSNEYLHVIKEFLDFSSWNDHLDSLKRNLHCVFLYSHVHVEQNRSWSILGSVALVPVFDLNGGVISTLTVETAQVPVSVTFIIQRTLNDAFVNICQGFKTSECTVHKSVSI